MVIVNRPGTVFVLPIIRKIILLSINASSKQFITSKYAPTAMLLLLLLLLLLLPHKTHFEAFVAISYETFSIQPNMICVL